LQKARPAIKLRLHVFSGAFKSVGGTPIFIDKGKGSHIWDADGNEYQYPPLWGDHSYNSGAGLFRMSNLAGYAKSNMPFGVSFAYPVLSDEEAWDVAAYINSQPRPSFNNTNDWPDISKKPIDHPFGPFADSFDENQHKYGPFAEIKNWKDKHSK